MSDSNDTRGVRALIHDAVDSTTQTVQKIHLAIATAPLDALAKSDALEPAAHQLRERQEVVVSAVYDAVRRVNREVQQLGNELLG